MWEEGAAAHRADPLATSDDTVLEGERNSPWTTKRPRPGALEVRGYDLSLKGVDLDQHVVAQCHTRKLRDRMISTDRRRPGLSEARLGRAVGLLSGRRVLSGRSLVQVNLLCHLSRTVTVTYPCTTTSMSLLIASRLFQSRRTGSSDDDAVQGLDGSPAGPVVPLSPVVTIQINHDHDVTVRARVCVFKL